MTITALTAAGTYKYDAAFAPHFTPAGQDSSDIQGSTAVSFDITVPDTNPRVADRRGRRQPGRGDRAE